MGRRATRGFLGRQDHCSEVYRVLTVLSRAWGGAAEMLKAVREGDCLYPSSYPTWLVSLLDEPPSSDQP